MSDLASRLNVALEGRYRVERELGEGAMATVFLADDLKHERQVALKVIKQELSAAMGAERFLAEIKTTANLQHPHILPLFDSGDADGMLYYVMPYVEGESLEDRLRRECPMPVDESVRLVAAIAGALEFAHARGVVHRDIKPGNILLQAGEPLLADFGIALAATQAGAERLTLPGSALGTPRYMSPEQASGDAPVGPASDTYSLGSVLYEMLTGDAPFTGSTRAITTKLLTQKPVPVREMRDAVPVDIAAAVEKAMARFAADRYPSVGDFAEALRGATGGEDAAAPVSVSATRGQLAGARSVGRLFPSVVALVTVLAAGIYLAGRAGETRAELMGIVASQVGFVVSSPASGRSASTTSAPEVVPFTQPVPAREILVDRVTGVYVPPATRLDGSLYPGANYPADILLVTPTDGGVVQLDPLEVPVGTQVTARAAVGAAGFEIVTDRGETDVKISLRGPVMVTVPDGIDEVLDFGPGGGQLFVSVAESGFMLGFTPAGAAPSCEDCAGLVLNLPVSHLDLSAVDETVGLESSAVQRVSTVHAGLLSLPGLQQNLQPSEVVRFAAFEGEIGRMDVGQDSLRFDAAATRVAGIHSSVGDDLMPTRFAVMGTGRRIAWGTGLAVFLLFLFFVVPRFSTTEPR